MANDMLVKEVANISTDVLSELGKLVSAYKDYTETLAAVQKQIEYTKEYKEKQTQTARENLVRKTAGTCDTIRIQLESLENTVNSLDQTLNVADPELYVVRWTPGKQSGSTAFGADRKRSGEVQGNEVCTPGIGSSRKGE